jgi:hypothetical protein
LHDVEFVIQILKKAAKLASEAEAVVKHSSIRTFLSLVTVHDYELE